jgi:hypothetical protein
VVDDQIIATTLAVDHDAITRIEVGITPPGFRTGELPTDPSAAG